MKENVSTNVQRLKYKNKFIELKTITRGGIVLDLGIFGPVDQEEKKTFNKITNEIRKLLNSGVTSKTSIVGTINRMVNVDRDILDFMKKLVNSYLILK